MCGITGFIDTANRTGCFETQLTRMTGAIKHRGPDADGHWIDQNNGVALGHRRLSIIDLSETGAQPMASKCGRYIITFNGEIYNHLEIRKVLSERGFHQWRGQSDTETLVTAISLLGMHAALQLTEGMFAFAVWDRADRTLSLARDRIGEKPL